VSDTRAAAHAWHAAGACVLPAKADGSKAPDVATWTSYQNTRPSPTQMATWFDSGQRQGLGVLCGAVSGNLEMVELEGRAVAEGCLDELIAIFDGAGLTDLWTRITDRGYAEKTPSGGIHIIYRLAEGPVPGNTKLAARPARNDELTDDEREILQRRPEKIITRGLAETRGEGGYVVIAPSHGTTHPTGRPWIVTNGGPDSIPAITHAEREQIHRAFRCLDRVPQPDLTTPSPRLQVVRDDGSTSPGDDFEQKTDWTDQLLLGGLNWKVLTSRAGGYRTWKRSGKDTPGISATTGRANDRDRLYVFSSSTEFDTEVPLTKLHVYAVIHHGGNHRAAGQELKRLGYGTPRPLSPDPLPPQPSTPAPAAKPSADIAIVDGNTARVLTEPMPAPERFGPTQDGLARALVTHYLDQLRYCPQRGRWLRWTGHRWLWDDAEHHRELIRALARRLPDGDGWARFKAGALSAAGVTGVERLARSDARVVVNFDHLDANPWALNTPSGIVDLRTGQMSAPDPAQLHTRSTGASPHPDANQSTWEEFLKLTFAGDDDLISYLQRLVGYSATGTVGAHVLPFCHGSGGNGKGVFLEAATAVLGDYATTAPNNFLMAKQYAGHETEIARLAGARMVVCSEVNDDDRFDEAKVKQLTGGDTLTARFMRQDHFTFSPSHQLWLMGNHQPQVRAGGESFWRRLRLIPFTRRIPEDQRIENFQQTLAAEHGSALLNWIITGAVAYRANGFAEPATVKSATADYAAGEDHFGRFFDECCIISGPPVRLETRKLWSGYESWCRGEGETPMSTRSFGREIKRRFGIERKPSNGRYFYPGITLIIDEEEDRWSP
jgi:putative DNA primase/helicase